MSEAPASWDKKWDWFRGLPGRKAQGIAVCYKEFIHLKCEFFPCHDLKEWHSCLFCYCPLFFLSCPGEFSTLPSGVKDCSGCVIPHTEKGWDIIQNELSVQVYGTGAAK